MSLYDRVYEFVGMLLRRLRELAAFNGNLALWVIAALGACAWVWARCSQDRAAGPADSSTPPAALMLSPPADAPLPPADVMAFLALAWLGYLYYFVRVGGDFLPMHRLFLPALPLQAVLAVGAVASLWRALSVKWAPRLALAPLQVGRLEGALVAAAAIVGLWVCGEGLAFSLQQGHFATRRALSRSHGHAGRDLQALAAQHAFRPRVLAQDMGLLPFSSPDVDYIDAIGLTNRRVATILHRQRYSPYTRYLVWHSEPRRRAIEAMEGELRALFSTELAPDYAVINADIPSHATTHARRAARRGHSAFFRPFVESNVFFYGWPRTRFFRERYVFARAYAYSPSLYLVTYRRTDRPWLAEPSGG